MQIIGRKTSAIVVQVVHGGMERRLPGLHAGFAGHLAALAQVAGRTGGDDVVPGRLAAETARDQVIEGEVVFGTAILALEFVAQEYVEVFEHGQAMALDSSLPEVWVGLGDAYLGAKLFQEAVDAYEQALTLAPQTSDEWKVHQGLANAYVQMGQDSSAVSHAQEALSLAPEEERASLQALLAELQASED